MIISQRSGRAYQKPGARSVYELLRSHANQTSEAIAFMAPGRESLTYARLFDQVEKTVATLRAFGLNRNDRIAIVLPNGPEMAVAFVALAAAATCAPLNPAYRVNEFDFYVSDLKAKALIVGSESDSPAREVARKHDIPIIELTPTLESGAGLFELKCGIRGTPGVDSFALPDDAALVLHTSGTTSRPKIVPLTQANICTSAHNISVTLDLQENDRCLNVMPLFHIHGLIGAILSSLTAGASVVCTPGFDPARFLEWLDALQPTWYTAVPTMQQAILARASSSREIIARRPLRFIRSCSASLPEAVMVDLEKVFNAPVIESYGMTEAAHQMTSNQLPPLLRKAGSVGTAAGPDVSIMDAAGNLLPVGQVGEVVIRGANVTAGYENNPKANEGAFSNGWFRTGDQGRFDADGYLFLTGRIKELINRGGEKIAPREVDEILIQHPAVAQAIAFAVPHPTLGEDIAAAVVLRENAAVTETEIRDFASLRLADFKVPSRVVFVEEIPKGPTGKLQRIGLAEKLATHLTTKYVAPKDSIEQQLADIWKHLLRVEQVGVHDNFNSLGGDSLATASMVIEIEERFHTTISVDDFLRMPTIETLAGLIRKKEPARPDSSVEMKEKNGIRPIRDTALGGAKNRLLQLLAFYAPGYMTTRIWLHRMRGVSIGDNVSIGVFAMIENAYPRLVSIGNNVTIGMRTTIIGHLRDLTKPAREIHQPTVRIEDNVYIGPGVIVLPNVTIGRGAVVSAGSVVSRSVPPETLVQGNPARPVARCGVSLGGGVSYEQFLRHLVPIVDQRPAGTDP